MNQNSPVPQVVCCFTIPGYCQPKQRTIGKFITPPETRLFEKTVRSYASTAMCGKAAVRGFIRLEMDIICKVHSHWTKKKVYLALTGKIYPTHCDIDNCIKSISDGMNRIVYEDDRQINSLIVTREFGMEEFVDIKVYELA